MICTFFGHRDADERAENKLREVLVDLIVNKGIRKYMVGNNGGFDKTVRRVLKQLKSEYDIEYMVVLYRLPLRKKENEDYSDTVFPEFLRNVPPQYAISRRNDWLIENSDIVVTYVIYPFGGAAKYKDIAEKRGKTVINLAQPN